MSVKVILRRGKCVNLRNSVLIPTILSSTSGYHGEGALLPAYEVRILEKYYISFQGVLKGEAKIVMTFASAKHDPKCGHVDSPHVGFWEEPDVLVMHDFDNRTPNRTVLLSGIFSRIGLIFRTFPKCRCPMMIKISGIVGQDYVNDTLLMVNADPSS